MRLAQVPSQVRQRKMIQNNLPRRPRPYLAPIVIRSRPRPPVLRVPLSRVIQPVRPVTRRRPRRRGAFNAIARVPRAINRFPGPRSNIGSSAIVVDDVWTQPFLANTDGSINNASYGIEAHLFPRLTAVKSLYSLMSLVDMDVTLRPTGCSMSTPGAVLTYFDNNYSSGDPLPTTEAQYYAVPPGPAIYTGDLRAFKVLKRPLNAVVDVQPADTQSTASFNRIGTLTRFSICTVGYQPAMTALSTNVLSAVGMFVVRVRVRLSLPGLFVMPAGEQMAGMIGGVVPRVETPVFGAPGPVECTQVSDVPVPSPNV